MIQIFDAHQDYQFFKPELEKAAIEVMRSGWFVLGQRLLDFETAFAEYTGARFACGVANGYDALLLSLMALDIGPGDEVITSAHSFIATALPIAAVGATPVFVDIDATYNLDPAQVVKAITPKTKAIVPVHLYGQLCDIEHICQIARDHKLLVIEDACQAHGARKNGQHAGTFGDIGCFSFYPTKNLGALGDAGAIVTNSPAIRDRILLLRNYGQKVKYVHEALGHNSRMDEIQAALLSIKLTKLDWSVTRRQEIAQQYLATLADCRSIELPKIADLLAHAFHLFVIACDQRDELSTFLTSRGIQTMVHYPVPITKQKVFTEYNQLSFPQTERASARVLSLPMHPYLTDDDIKSVTNAIKEFYA